MKTTINYNKIPAQYYRSVKDYIEYGHDPGTFLTQIFANNLVSSFLEARSNNISTESLHDYTHFLYHNAPPNCWGNIQKVQAWIKKGGQSTTE